MEDKAAFSDKEVSLVAENVKKISVLRANALGDFIVTLPALNALKKTYPHAELILFGKPWHKEFLVKGRSPVDRVIVVPAIKGIRDEITEATTEEVERFFSEVQNEKIDVALHFQGKGIAASKFLNRLNARITIGMTSPGAEKIDRSINYFYYQNEVARYLEVVSLVGVKPYCLHPSINLLDSDLVEAEFFFNGEIKKKFIVFHTCSTDIRRMWQPEKFCRLAEILAKSGYEIVFTGTADDLFYVDPIIKMLKGSAVNACGKLSFGGLAGIFSMSELVISVDTGPLHLATAVGAKTIGLFWAPNVINWSYLTRAKHIPVIAWKMNCPICNIVPNDPFPFEPITESCAHNVSFIEEITVEQVAERAMELLR